jgi:ketosteroid isomerase-like protein
MSQENVEVVQRTWQAFLENDVQAALSSYDPDIEWDGTNLPDGQVSRGVDAIMDHITRWSAMSESWTVGLDMDERHAELYRIRDGRIVRRQGFADPKEALRAVGLANPVSA